MTDKTQKDSAAAEYSVSNGLAQRLARLNVSIAASSYQSNLLYLIGRNKQNGINVHQTVLPRPMGLSVDKPNNAAGESVGLTMTAAYQVMRFENTLQQGQEVNQTFDACFTPRTINVTGRLDAHDVGIDAEGGAVFVNTRFNCLAVPSTKHSFEPIWTPPFISTLVDEDRCHLNGMAMKDGKPKYVTAVSQSNTIDGWRDRRANGGVVIDVESNEIVCEGLSMPHSPRLHNGQLWVLNSGTGELGTVALEGPKRDHLNRLCSAPAFCAG